jgi:lipopolysaccharide assembly protein A
MATDPPPAPNPKPAEPSTPGPPVGTQDQPALEPQAPSQPPGSAGTTQVLPAQHRIKRTRTSGVWVAVAFFAVILLLLLIFILQNGQHVDISYLGAHGHLPLGVALLLAAVCGVLLVVLAGTARISQLRATARRHRRVDAKRAKAAASDPAGPVR